MNTIDEMIDVLQKSRLHVVQRRHQATHGPWIDDDLHAWNFGVWDYRVKPQPEERPADTQRKIEVMQAFLDGATIEYRYRNGRDREWKRSESPPGWAWEVSDYRIKPGPAECWGVAYATVPVVRWYYSNPDNAQYMACCYPGGRVIHFREVQEDC